MKFANAVNGLVVKFLKIDIDEEKGAEMLVMERLYPMDFRAHELERRVLWFEVFEDEIAELHKAGFVHRDISVLPALAVSRLTMFSSRIRSCG